MLKNKIQQAISIMPKDINGDYIETIKILMDIDQDFITNDRKTADTAHFIWTRLDMPETKKQGRQALIDWEYLLSK